MKSIKTYALIALSFLLTILTAGYYRRGAKLDRIKAKAAEQETKAYDAAMNAESRGHKALEKAKELAKIRKYFK